MPYSQVNKAHVGSHTDVAWVDKWCSVDLLSQSAKILNIHYEMHVMVELPLDWECQSLNKNIHLTSIYLVARMQVTWVL